MDVNNIIDQLLSVRGARPGRQVTLTENEIKWLCNKGREVFTSQPVLLELEAPIKVRRALLLTWDLRNICCVSHRNLHIWTAA